MKSKIFGILGVVLTIIMLVGMFVPVTSVSAQAYTPNRWNQMIYPGSGVNPVFKLLGGNVIDFAIAPDGHTMYATDTAGPLLFKSPNGGSVWAPVTLPAGFTNVPTLVAVAPDDPTKVAVVEEFGANVTDSVWYSTNGGATWGEIDPLAVAGANQDIYGIAISPARADALLGRDIVICTAKPAAGTYGDVFLIGDTGTWVNISNAAGIGATYDFTSVKFEPNWLGGRCVVAVGSNAGGTFLEVIKTAPAIVLPYPAGLMSLSVANCVGAGFGPFGLGAAANGIITSSLALPSDFDSTTPPAISAYVGLHTAAANLAIDDVYRQDFDSTRKLEVKADIAIQSIAFTGTLSGGTLVAASALVAAPNPLVYTSSNPNTALPTWLTTVKNPTGATGGTNAIVLGMAPDYDTSKTMYAGTTGNECGFSRSTNGGTSFNQIGLINTGVVTLDDVMPTQDNATLFLTTLGGWGSSLWRSATPPTDDSWERVNLSAVFAPHIIRLSPDYGTDATLYWCVLLGTDIQVTNTGGEIFATRTAPQNIQDFAVESKDIVYMANGNNVYKSTNGSWFFGLPIPAPMGAVRSLAMAPTYPEKPKAGNVLVGGAAGEIGLSTDGGASYIPLAGGIGGAFTQVCADKGYASNNMVYASSTGGTIFRFEVGVSTAWEAIDVIGNPVTGLATESGTLYGSYWWGGPNSAADRSLAPFVPDIAQLTFVQMDVGAAGFQFRRIPSALRAAGTTTSTWLWTIDTNGPNLMSYNDTMAKAVVKVSVPANVPNDPSSGRNIDFTITWDKPSNAFIYNYGVYTDANCTQATVVANGAYVPADPLTPAVVIGNGLLAGGQKYYVRVFVVDETPGDAIDSPRAPQAIKIVSFTVQAGAPIEMPAAGPTLLSPTPGDMAVPLRPGFSWSTMPGATGATGALSYEFILATDSALTQTIGGTPATVNGPSFGLSADLNYDTTYYYAVKVTAPTTSAQSIASFHTMAKAAPPVTVSPPVTVEQKVINPSWVWAIVIIGAILVIAVIVLIVTTRRTP